jgi:hypothetical protein
LFTFPTLLKKPFEYGISSGYTYVSGKMTSIETVPGMGGRGG